MGSQGGFQAPRNSYQGSESGIQEQQQQSESQEGGKPRYIYRLQQAGTDPSRRHIQGSTNYVKFWGKNRKKNFGENENGISEL